MTAGTYVGMVLFITVMALPCAAAPIPLKADPFDLGAVRLLDGPFKQAQDIDAKYMLSLDPQRLLHTFRINAHLPTSAQPLGGWEAPQCEVRGHFVGHYISACAMMYQSTGNEEFKNRVDYMVAELAKCQQALGGEYLSAFPESFFDRLEAHQHVWAPYYTIHKILAGLLDAHHLCNNTQALTMATRMAAYFQKRFAKLTPVQIENMLHTTGSGPFNEFGGMSEALHDLYAITNNPDHLKLADQFDRPVFLDPLANSQDHLANLHANCHIPQVEGFARHYELTGDEKCRTAAEYFWNQVTGHHSFVTGSNSFGEHFRPPGVEAAQLSPTTAETCNTYNMLKLTRHLFQWNPDARYADYYERALYNHILASIDPQTGMTMYFLSLMPGHFKVYGTPTDSFWCCNGTGLENHAKYGDSIYFHNDSTLWVNLFIPSELTWKEKGIFIRQETSFPKQDNTTLTIKSAQPTKLALQVRVPYWATNGITVKINGEETRYGQSPIPGSYLSMDRTWHDGDTVELSFPMTLHLYHAADRPDHVAVMYGPLVLAGELGRKDFPPTDQAHDQNQFGKIHPVDAPIFQTNNPDPNTWIKPVDGKPLTFTTVNVGHPNDVTLIPLYQLHHERYTVYWKLEHLPKAIPTAKPADSVGVDQ